MNTRGVTVAARSDGDAVFIAIAGEIDLSNAEFVEQQIVREITNHTMKASIDLTAVDYIDSIGMRVLFTIAIQMETTQIGLTVIAPIGSPARRVIEISGFDSIVALEPAV